MTAKQFSRLTLAQECIVSFVSRSSRWLTAEEISMATGLSLPATKVALGELLKLKLVNVKTRIGGFEHGEREFRRVITAIRTQKANAHTDRITGVPPIAKRLRRILGKEKALKYAEFIE